ncbi:tetraspanin-13 isoform X2 [Haemorhous mexicanus]|uniref:tetraspanin-13 isoform X2 n=1 Tax=Haemorhous mexicanus TaxID=30427 RepID=UPI0028BF567A|nr:tetraspanin-13 isoform X2 [Haemorhous mexicanus]
MFSLGLHRLIGVRRHRRGAAARAGTRTAPRRGPAGGGQARARVVTAAGSGERGPGLVSQQRGTRLVSSQQRGQANGARVVTATGNGDKRTGLVSSREWGTGTAEGAPPAQREPPDSGRRRRRHSRHLHTFTFAPRSGQSAGAAHLLRPHPRVAGGGAAASWRSGYRAGRRWRRSDGVRGLRLLQELPVRPQPALHE